MIELKKDDLRFSFPEVHPKAVFSLNFQRTLRIPDDGTSYPLPPGLGSFPVVHVDDHADDVPRAWLRHGGVMLPMYQSEALWLHFAGGYPMAIKVATGKINAVTGQTWNDGLHDRPQDYMVSPGQPWLDGYCVEKGYIRQFVAMPLGAGYTAEEQITGEAQFGGLQVIVYPMKARVWESLRSERYARYRVEPTMSLSAATKSVTWGGEMGLAPGGRMRQEIYDDPYGMKVWDREHASRCFVHLANSLVWKAITGREPPPTPATAKRYNEAGLPWFDYYRDDVGAVEGADRLAELRSVKEMGEAKGDVPLPENESVTPQLVRQLRGGLREGQVREGSF